MCLATEMRHRFIFLLILKPRAEESIIAAATAVNRRARNFIVNLLRRVHLVIENLELRKLSTFLIDRAKLSLIGPTIAINISIPEIYATGNYNISGVLGDMYRLQGAGPFQMTIRDFRAYVNTALGYSRGMYMKSFILDFSLRAIKIHLENFMGGDDIGKIMSKVRFTIKSVSISLSPRVGE